MQFNQLDLVPIAPPSDDHVLAVHAGLPKQYRLPLLVLDATGMRLGELETLRWKDVDERECRWRISASSAKTRQARWVSVPPVMLDDAEIDTERSCRDPVLPRCSHRQAVQPESRKPSCLSPKRLS